MKPRSLLDRYRLNAYSNLHWAIDCTECKVKIANLKPDTPASDIIIRLNAHDQKHG